MSLENTEIINVPTPERFSKLPVEIDQAAKTIKIDFGLQPQFQKGNFQDIRV